MTAGDAVRFLVSLAAVAEIFERELSDAAQTLYFDALADLPLDACLQALEAAAKTATFMPRPAELRALTTGPGVDLELATEAAWQTFQDTASRVGAYESPTFEDAALAATIIAMFGLWELACWTEMSPEMWVARRKEFGRIYRLYRERGLVGPMRLIGFCDRTNRDRGYRLTDGDQKLLMPASTRDEWRVQREHADLERSLARAERNERVQRELEAAIDRRDAAKVE